MAQSVTGGANFDVLTCSAFTPPAGCITDQSVQANAQIAATKLQQQGAGIDSSIELFGPAVSVAALTKVLGMAFGAGTLVALSAHIEVVASGADRTIAIDLQASVAGGAYATVLTTTVNFTNGTVVRTAVAAVILTAAYVAGTIFRVVVTVAGAAGAQATGLTMRLIKREASQ